ncbi:MAG: hypothetical protein PGN34_14880 [Methylobacterium frigidaeris]
MVRLLVLGGFVLAATGGCTRPPPPQAWSDLPGPAMHVAVDPGDEPAWEAGFRPARRRAALRDPLMVDPLDALIRSATDRRRWSGQAPTDFATLVWKPIALQSSDRVAPGGAADAASGSPDGQAALNRLAKALDVSVKPICRGC